jgi:hypothetical protein
VHLDDTIDFRLVETARVIDAAPKLRPLHVGQRLDGADCGEVDRLSADIVLRRTAGLFAGGISGKGGHLAIAERRAQRDDDGDDRRGGLVAMEEAHDDPVLAARAAHNWCPIRRSGSTMRMFFRSS